MHLIANYSKLLLSICVNAQSKKKKKEEAPKVKEQRESHYKSSYSIPLKQWQLMHLWFQKGKFPTRFGRKPRIPKITSGKTRCIEWKFFLLHLFVPLLYACNVSQAFLLPMAKIVDCLRFCLDNSKDILNRIILSSRPELKSVHIIPFLCRFETRCCQ